MNRREPEVQEKIDEEENISEVADIPFAGIEPLPEVVKENRPAAEEKERRAYKNKAPLQDDEKNIILIKEALKNPVNITTEDLLNISDAARQGLKNWLTKKRVDVKLGVRTEMSGPKSCEALASTCRLRRSLAGCLEFRRSRRSRRVRS